MVYSTTKDMARKSFLITTFWVLLGVAFIFSAVFFSTASAEGDTTFRNYMLAVLIILAFIFVVFLPVFFTIKVIKNWKKLKGRTYIGNANNGFGLFMLSNLLLGLYMFVNFEKVVTLAILNDKLVLGGSLVSFGFLLYGSYYLAKSKGQSGWLALLELFYPIGLIIILVLPDKYKNKQ